MSSSLNSWKGFCRGFHRGGGSQAVDLQADRVPDQERAALGETESISERGI